MTAPHKIRNTFDSRSLTLTVNVVLWLVLLITTIATFVPFSPGMPGAGLDPSWVFGMNQATAQGISFGKGIIFTYGPYASIATKSYHPSTDFMMVSGSLYLALSYWACFVLLMKNVQWRWVLAFGTVLAGLMYLRDALFFSLPLLVGLLIFKILILEKGRLVKSKLAPLYVALLFAPFGLLPLIKGTILILCGAITVLCSIFFIANKQRVLAITCLFSPLVSMVFFWVLTGQSVGNLPNYFIAMAHIASGYSEAMAVNGNNLEVILYLIASAFLLLAISIQPQITHTSKMFLFCIYFVFLFLSFKGGFVRHDGHAIMSGTSILIAAVLLPFNFNVRIILPVIVFAFIAWAYIDSHYMKTSTEHIFHNFKANYSSAWYGIKHRIENRNWPRPEFDAAVNSLREQAAFPVLPGTTDIYSYNQSYLIASGNSWSPRPVLQSYSVYTPELAEINRKHLLGSQAPDNIIFSVEPIDGRIPSIEDGVSWPILMRNYRPTRMEKQFLFLQKKERISDVKEPVQIKSEMAVFGESVLLPHSRQPVFAQIEIGTTILGRLVNIFFKPSQLQITLKLNNGMEKQYRIISGMAKSGFVVSPLIENTVEFGRLYGKENILDGKLVESMVIGSNAGGTMLWKNRYSVTFSQIRTGVPIDISWLYKFDEFDDELSASDVIPAEKCEGNIDVVNDTFPIPENFSVSGLLSVNGWLVVSVEEAILPEAVYVVLTDDQGNHKYIRTRQNPRPDVGAYFNKPELARSGYITMADISAFEGQYSLGLAIKQSDKIKICPQFNIPAMITK
jgi:hypothetical protein